jgi:hypothetical protein
MPSRFTAQTREKRLARALELFFEAARAIALRARPRFGAVQIAAVSTCVRIFDADQIEVFLPIRSLFLERDPAEANLHPMGGAVVSRARLLHIPEILVARDGAAAERAIFNRPEQSLLFARLHASFHQIAHGSNSFHSLLCLCEPTYSDLSDAVLMEKRYSSFFSSAVPILYVIKASP